MLNLSTPTTDQEQLDYEEHIKINVLLAEKRLDKEGSDNLTSEQVKNNVINTFNFISK